MEATSFCDFSSGSSRSLRDAENVGSRGVAKESVHRLGGGMEGEGWKEKGRLRCDGGEKGRGADGGTKVSGVVGLPWQLPRPGSRPQSCRGGRRVHNGFVPSPSGSSVTFRRL